MWLTIAQWALLTFIVIGVTLVVVTFFRNSRRFKSQRLRSNPDLGPSTTWAIVPPTPLPEWVDWDDDAAGDDDTAPRRQQ